MQVFGAGAGDASGRDWMSPEGRARSKRAGWWFWYPLIFGIFFVVMGVAFVVGASSITAASGGLGISAVVFFVVGLGSLAVAWWAWRDIHADDEPRKVAGSLSAQAQQDLQMTGVSGQATINSFSYVAGSSDGATTLVALDLDVHTVAGGHVPLTTKSRVPLAVANTLGKGATVPMVLSSTDPNQHVIEWAGLLPAPATPPAAS